MASYTTYGIGISRSSTFVKLRRVHCPTQAGLGHGLWAPLSPAQPLLDASTHASRAENRFVLRAIDRANTAPNYITHARAALRARNQHDFSRARAFNGDATEGTWWWGEGAPRPRPPLQHTRAEWFQPQVC